MAKVWKKEQISRYHREDGTSWLLYVDGERAGEITSELENTGSILSPRWKTTSYTAIVYTEHGPEREFLVGDRSPLTALAEAKRFLLDSAQLEKSSGS